MLTDIIYFVIYIVALYCTVLWFFVLIKNRSQFFSNRKIKNYPGVTFLVPAYNEEHTISSTIKSILNLDYPSDKTNIIVINDGSTDKTRKICEGFGDKIKLINQKNKGKAAAMNHGLEYVNTELVVSMDADSEPARDYLQKMISEVDKDTSFVTPALKTKGKASIMQKVQWVEYLFSILLRKVFSFFNCQYVAPGPGSIYRTKVIKEVGGFDEHILTEDMEIAFKMHTKNYKSKNKPDAYVFTETPKKFNGFYKQRLRWYRGYFQTVSKHSYMLFNKKYGNLGVFLLPVNYIWVGVLMFLGGFTTYNIAKIIFDTANMVSLVHADVGPMVNMSMPTLMGFSIHHVFMVVLMGFSLLVIGLSLKASKESAKIRKNYLSYILFLLLYPILMMIFWGASVLHNITKRQNKW